MNTAIERYRAEQRERFYAFRDALSNESDRGCALFAAAYLDVGLAYLLRSCMVPSKGVECDLFSAQAPLSDFSARIKLAYYLGKLSPSQRADLEVIRRIRNDFAHHPEYLDFEAQTIKDRCSNLANHWHAAEARPRTKFTGAVSMLLAVIHAESAKAEPASEKANMPMSEQTKEQIRSNGKQMADNAFEAMLQSLKELPDTDDAQPGSRADLKRRADFL